MNRVQWLPPAVVTALNAHAANERKIAGLITALEAGEQRADLVASSMHFSDPNALREELRLLAISFRAALALAREGGAK